jgi:hypothetical protein
MATIDGPVMVSDVIVIVNYMLKCMSEKKSCRTLLLISDVVKKLDTIYRIKERNNELTDNFLRWHRAARNKTISLFEPDVKFENDECPICGDDYQNKEAVYLLCGHKLHRKCANDMILRHGHGTCPICRRHV